jgi:pilus assembly protein CpaB
VPDSASAVGRVAKADLLPGEILVEGRLFPPGRTEDLPQVLPVPLGKRAVTVAVDEVVGVAGFVMPGTHVDVVGTLDVEGQAVTRVILQRILVLAIAQDAKRKDDPEAKIVSSATLAVTPQESQMLILAADRGKIRLAMRGPNEGAAVQIAPITPAALLGHPAPREHAQSAPKTITRTVVRERAIRTAVPAPHATPLSIMVIRGTQTETVYREDR